MSSSNANRSVFARRTLRVGSVVFVAVASLGLAGCGGSGFQPLYGATATGESVADELRKVDISPIPGRVGQRLRNELIFNTTGGGYADAPAYRLEIAIREAVKSILVKVDGDAGGRVYELRASFKLFRNGEKDPFFSDTGITRASFQQFDPIFSNIRARIDAENRAARTLAQSIRTRVAAAISRAS